MPGLSATYSPEDNKLRLYASTRLPQDIYERVHAAGFRWAPKQQLFVAPKWTPGREDLLLQLCDEIGDEDTSLVERAEDRADRFDGYGERRAEDAQQARATVQAITEHIPFGQPILVGHHSERRARKDAESIENGMRRAIRMWDTSKYWQQRAAGAIQHAKYKELPAVRHRRIKTIEAELRKTQKIKSDAEKFLAAWAKDGLTYERAKALTNHGCHIYRRFPVDQYPRPEGASVYEGDMSIWSALEGRIINEVQARNIAVPAYQRSVAGCDRWIAHYENRLSYERAMLNEQIGAEAGTENAMASRFDIQVGGQVLVGREWLVVTRINRSGGKVTSVTTNARYVRIKGIEEVTDYRAPDAEQAEKVKAATKLPPLANYPGDGFEHITQAQWDKIPKEYKSTKHVVPATDSTARHRVRNVLGVYVVSKDETDWNKRHRYAPVFITDAKRTEAPAATAAATVERLPPPIPAELPEPPRCQDRPERTAFDDMRDQLKAGVQVVAAPQLFPTPPELATRMVEMAEIEPGHDVLEPSAGTGRLVIAIKEAVGGQDINITAVEIKESLAGMLRSAHRVPTHCADFLDCGQRGLGVFDRIVMNPPFAAGQDIAHIKLAATMLKPGGRLVALCAAGPRQHAALRPLADEWEVLPPGSFSDEGTGVNVALLVITAPS